MTRKLYDLDSHRRDFSATVLRCDPDGERYAVVLDQTVFFPEGGGQPTMIQGLCTAPAAVIEAFFAAYPGK